MDRGLFITFEGIDGCGKSTQIGLLTACLEDIGKPFLLVREPGGTVIGEKIRSILLDKENNEMSPEAELLLFEAARAQIVAEKIRPAIEAGTTVICDRFYDSIERLEKQIASACEIKDVLKQAEYYHDYVLAEMDIMRSIADEIEINMPLSYWPIPTYSEIIYNV
jgi:thymidylate kinase